MQYYQLKEKTFRQLLFYIMLSCLLVTLNFNSYSYALGNFDGSNLLASSWFEGESTRDGASKMYSNSEARYFWKNKMGDWCDQQLQPQGNSAIFEHKMFDIKANVVSLDVTSLVKSWIQNKSQDRTIILRGINGNGIYNFFSRETEDKNLHPKLVISSGDNEISFYSVADTYLDNSTYKSLGKEKRIKVSKDRITFIRFDIQNINRIKKARLFLQVKKTYGNQLTLGLFQSCIPNFYKKDDVKKGLAAGYHLDKHMLNDPRVILMDYFDDWWWRGEQWTYGSDSSNLSTVEEDPKNKFEQLSGKALRVEIKEGGRKGLQMGFVFQKSGLKEPEEIYFRYYLRFADDWNTIVGGKLPGLSGTYDKAGWGGRKSNGYNGWSARGWYGNQIDGKNPLSEKIPIGNYIYHAEIGGNYGDIRAWSNKALGYLEKNKWYCLEQYVKLNTPGKSDGVIKAWVDGKPAARFEGLRFRNTKDLKIDRLWMNVYHGGLTNVAQDIHLYIDNVVLATEYIGPINGI